MSDRPIPAAPYLHTGRLALRPFQADDSGPIYAAIQESAGETSPWLPELDRSTSLDDITRYIAVQPDVWRRGLAYNFVILEHSSRERLGGCGLTYLHPRHNFANLFYWVRTSYTGQGIASSAARLLARWGLFSLNLQRIEIVVDVDNLPSQRVAEKAGARREGILHNRLNARGEPRDALMYSLLPEDFDSPVIR